IRNFMAQTGDPTGTGTGGPGYRFADEPVKRKYERGTLAMANAGPNTNGSQFFIITGERGAALPPQYSLLGTITSGMDVAREIEADGNDIDGAPPKKVHKILKVTIEER
ncbi:MAG: peptidylprolyl isomerase, partial [Acidimicrobiia bacterium]